MVGHGTTKEESDIPCLASKSAELTELHFHILLFAHLQSALESAHVSPGLQRELILV